VKNILITGCPGVGKTTLVRRLVPELAAWQPVGFYTEEIRESGVRRGFEWVDLRGRRGVLSHVALHGPYRVGRYGVDVQGFEAYLASLDLTAAESRVLFIDEIGKMECLSARFRSLLKQALESERPLVATIALKGTGFIEAVKSREDVELHELRPDNRDSLARHILGRLGEALSGTASPPPQA
jgi:nucleoside-triphosphatase